TGDAEAAGHEEARALRVPRHELDERQQLGDERHARGRPALWPHVAATAANDDEVGMLLRPVANHELRLGVDAGGVVRPEARAHLLEHPLEDAPGADSVDRIRELLIAQGADETRELLRTDGSGIEPLRVGHRERS